MTNDVSEKRRRTRVPVRLAVTVRVERQEIPVTSRNLSLKGLACTPNPCFKENRCCQVVIRLAPHIQAVIKGRVVRVGETEAAIDFLAMDLESFTHLKKIVEYHSPVPENISQELLVPAFSRSRPRTTFPRRGRDRR